MKKLLFTLLSFVFIFGAAEIAHAATWTVTKAANSDDGVCNADCSLREAVAVANSGDSIIFNSNLIGQTFTLGGTPIVYSGKRLEIDGNIDGVNVAFLSGSNTSNHFEVWDNGSLTLKNMILALGNNGGRGSILTFNSSLHLDRVSIRGNTSNTVGAIELISGSPRTHSIRNSSITGNTATGGGGAQFAAIHVSANDALYMSNTTVSNNRTLGNTLPNNDFGAIFTVGKLFLRNCTITGNEGNYGGGIALRGYGDSDAFDVGNSIIAGNSAAIDGEDIHYIPDPETDITSRGGNLIGNTDTLPAGSFTQTKDIVNVNPLLAPTNSNQGGHPVFTHPLQAGSPAIGGGLNAVAIDPLSNLPLDFDARGTSFPRISGGTVDKGAFEDQSNGSTLVVTKLANSNDNVCDTDCSLREAVFAAGVDPGTDNITFAANVFGTMIVGSEIDIQNQNVNIIGYPSLSSNTLIVSGNNASRVFNIENSNVSMTGFTIAGGNGAGSSQPFGGGGILTFGGNLTLNQMIIRNNATAASDLGSGGGLAVFSGSVVRIMNSTINNNSSYSSLGAKIDASVIYITNTTIANNSYIPPGEANFGALTINGTLYMRNSTIANNRSPNSPTGAGLYCGGASTCNLGNNIFADNIATTGNDLFVGNGGSLVSVGGNLVEDTTGYNTGIFSQTSDQTALDAGLLALSDNGGNVTTIMLSPTSPAINSGINSNATDPFSAAPLATDGRGSGFLRIVSVVDKGAFETLIPTSAAVTVSGKVFNGEGKAASNAKVYLTDSNGITRIAVTNNFGNFTFDTVSVGETYIINIYAKKWQYNPQIINVSEEIVDLTFAPQE